MYNECTSSEATKERNLGKNWKNKSIIAWLWEQITILNTEVRFIMVKADSSIKLE